MVLSVELVRGTRGGEGWGLPSLPWAPGWSFCLCGCHLSEGEGSSLEVGGGTHPVLDVHVTFGRVGSARSGMIMPSWVHLRFSCLFEKNVF